MAGFNQVTLVGRLVADPELRKTQTGKNIATFTLAVDKYSEGANFINCETWERTAEYVNEYIHKGNLVLVSGTLEQNVWENKEGKKQSKLLVSVRSLQSLTSVKRKEDNPVEDVIDTNTAINLDDIPF